MANMVNMLYCGFLMTSNFFLYKIMNLNAYFSYSEMYFQPLTLSGFKILLNSML